MAAGIRTAEIPGPTCSQSQICSGNSEPFGLTLCSILTLDSCRLNVQYLAFLYPCLCLYLYVTPSIRNLLAYLYLYYLLRMCLVFVLLSIYFFKFSFYDCLICLLVCECLLCTINVQTIYDFCWSNREIEPKSTKEMTCKISDENFTGNDLESKDQNFGEHDHSVLTYFYTIHKPPLLSPSLDNVEKNSIEFP